jgi:predicted transcriptional regulator YdeE
MTVAESPSLPDAPPAPEIVERPAFRVVGLVYEGPYVNERLMALWEMMLAHVEELSILPDPPTSFTAYGVARELPQKVGGRIEYMAGLAAPAETSVPRGMTAWNIPARTYAVFPAQSLADIVPTIHYALTEWLPGASEWQAADGVYFEEYPSDFFLDAESPIRLHFPVTRR